MTSSCCTWNICILLMMHGALSDIAQYRWCTVCPLPQMISLSLLRNLRRTKSKSWALFFHFIESSRPAVTKLAVLSGRAQWNKGLRQRTELFPRESRKRFLLTSDQLLPSCCFIVRVDEYFNLSKKCILRVRRFQSVFKKGKGRRGRDRMAKE